MTTAIIPLAGIAIPLIIVPAVLVAKHLGRSRYYRHQERIEAIRAGSPGLGSTLLPGPGSVVAIGAGVPMMAILGALIATASIPSHVHTREMIPLLAIIWSTSTFVAVAGLTTSLILGILLHRAHGRTVEEAPRSSSKPAYDPDMFEPAGRGF